MGTTKAAGGKGACLNSLSQGRSSPGLSEAVHLQSSRPPDGATNTPGIQLYVLQNLAGSPNVPTK